MNLAVQSDGAGRLADFADMVPIVAVADARALGAGGWKQEAMDALCQHGGVVLRGPVMRQDGVEVALGILDDELLDDAFWSTPRKRIAGKTLTATEYPSPKTIQLHSEMAYMASFPRLLAFHALEVASEGGQTTVCDIARVTRDLGERIRDFADKGVMYRRTFQKGIDIQWQHAFQTDSRDDVAEVAARQGMTLEWLDGDALVTTHVAQGTIATEDGSPLWFNQSHLFHACNLEPRIREGIERLYGPGRLPRQAMYGDGSPIPAEAVRAVQSAFERNQTGMHWQPGDIMIIDNMRFAHGRMPFGGTRQLTVAMARLETEPVRRGLAFS